MKAKVYVLDNNGNYNEEEFMNDQEASNHAKAQSVRGNTFFTVYQTANNKIFFYENGEITNPRRKKELAKAGEEILLHRFQREIGKNKKV